MCRVNVTKQRIGKGVEGLRKKNGKRERCRRCMKNKAREGTAEKEGKEKKQGERGDKEEKRERGKVDRKKRQADKHTFTDNERKEEPVRKCVCIACMHHHATGSITQVKAERPFGFSPRRIHLGNVLP